MHPFSNILVYASLEDEAFMAIEQAASIARQNGASLTVVRILEDEGRFRRWKRRSENDSELREFLATSQRDLLEDHVRPLREEGIDVRVEVRWGSPWLELIHCVLRDGHDLVVKAAEGAARGRGLFFGSTALHLIRKCPCPVWVVSSAGDIDQFRVLAAIDPSEDDSRAAVAQRILDLAASMAGDEGEFHAASAWRAEGETLLTHRMPPEKLADYVRSSEEDARHALEQILTSAKDPVAQERVHLIKGHARRVLPELVERGGFDLIVMGSLGRVGIAGFLIGETAETLIRSVHCSVLVVKPPGFVSPVELPEEVARDSVHS